MLLRAFLFVVLFGSHGFAQWLDNVGYTGAALNTTAIGICELALYGCMQIYGFQNQSNQTYQTNCTTPFESCLSKSAYLVPQKAEDCFLADAEWINAKLTTAFSVSIFFFSTLIFPAVLKATSRTINDFSDHGGLRGKIAQVLLFFTTADKGERVTPSGLIAPQTIFSFASVTVPIYQVMVWLRQKAMCDYQKSLPPFAPAA